MSATLELTAEKVQLLADSSLALTAWREKGRALAQAHSGHQFAIGDWLASGDEKWGRKAYKEASSIFTSYAKPTLHTFASVARSVEPCCRNKDLPWDHHKAVARFKPELQRELLDFAANHSSGGNEHPNVEKVNPGMSLSLFRKHINKKYAPTKPQTPKSTKAILVTLNEDDLIWLRVVALRADNCSLGKAAELVLHDYRARWKAAFEGEAYAPEHPSLNEFYCKKEAA